MGHQPAIEQQLSRATRPNLHFCYVGLPGWLRFLRRFPGGFQLHSYFWQWKALFAARKLHRQIHFDLFHHLTYTNDWMASPIGALLPVPYVRGPGGGAHRTPMAFVRRYPLQERLSERFRVVGQWMLRHDPFFLLGQRRASALLVCNQEAFDAIPRRWRAKAQMFPVNGVSQDAFGKDRPPASAGNKFRVLSAGRLVRLKAFDLAIRAFGEFTDRIGTRTSGACVELVLVGDGPERNSLSTLSRSLGLDGSVRFERWKPRAELWDLMRGSDVFLFPSLRDGGGLVVVEAMAAGTPVVCVDLGGPGMHVTSECGFKVEPRTPGQVITDLATALETLLSNPELRLRMGRAAHERAERIYLWDRLAENILPIYENARGICLQSSTDRPAPQEDLATEKA